MKFEMVAAMMFEFVAVVVETAIVIKTAIVVEMIAMIAMLVKNTVEEMVITMLIEINKPMVYTVEVVMKEFQMIEMIPLPVKSWEINLIKIRIATIEMMIKEIDEAKVVKVIKEMVIEKLKEKSST